MTDKVAWLNIMYRIPEWAVAYVINGDKAGLLNSQVGLVDTWLGTVTDRFGRFHLLPNTPVPYGVSFSDMLEDLGYYADTNDVTDEPGMVYDIIYRYVAHISEDSTEVPSSEVK